MKAGIVLNFLVDNKNNQIIQFVYPLNKSKKIVLSKNDNLEFNVKETIAQLDKKIVFKEVTAGSPSRRIPNIKNISSKINLKTFVSLDTGIKKMIE